MLISMASADWSVIPGDVIDVAPEAAAAWIAAGMAEAPADASDQAEAQQAEPPQAEPLKRRSR